MEPAITKSEREALKAIYRCTRDGSEAHTGDLADSLGVTPGTVTATSSVSPTAGWPTTSSTRAPS